MVYALAAIQCEFLRNCLPSCRLLNWRVNLHFASSEKNLVSDLQSQIFHLPSANSSWNPRWSFSSGVGADPMPPLILISESRSRLARFGF